MSRQQPLGDALEYVVSFQVIILMSEIFWYRYLYPGHQYHQFL